MSLRKYWITAAAFIISCAPALSALSFDRLLDERLGENIPYRQAALQLRQAQLRVAQYDDFYLPYFSVGSGGPGHIRYVGGEGGALQRFNLQPSLTFSNILGASFAFGLPVTITPPPAEDQEAVTIGDPSLTVSRRIFEETDANILGARASLIRALDTEKGARSDVRIGLVSEVFEARSAVQTLIDTRRRLENARRIRDASRDDTVERDLERSILQAERAVIQAGRALRSIDERVVEYVDTLYPEILERYDEWIAHLPDADTIPLTSAGIQAQRMSLGAAEARRSLSFLPYLPNPSFSATFAWDREERELSWSVGLQFSVNLVDRGERAVAALERRESAEIERLRLDTLIESFGRSVRTAWEELELLQLDSRIQELDLEAQLETTERIRALYEAGFAGEESLISAELTLSSAQLQAEKTVNNYLLQQLRVLRYFE